ncbi:hypothetical protein PIB30_038908 [Stylosanthes scabra]|uniref:Non-specific lipid-transfer protein n=1 Tax=Stylosanthes scabra TaxID=79078 RepID=A0ABU6QDR5_9FABA|nr:hypothetical protein [Stylosanthes scabra]
MANNSNNSVVLCIALLVCATLLASSAPKAEALTCMQVVQDLMPCLSYVEYGGTVPAQCCNGIRTLMGAASTRQDHQTVCTCLKNAVQGVSFNRNTINLAAGLPSKCNVNLSYKIDPNVDCNR